MRVRLFGEVEVTGPPGATTLAGNKQRAILARLAIDADRVVSVDELVDGVWGSDVPDSVRSAVQVHISQIRRALTAVGADEMLTTRPPGYVLRIDPGCVDVLRFERLCAEAAADGLAPDDVLHVGRQAAELWLGPPLAAVGGAPFAEPVRTHLEGRRIELTRARATAAVLAHRAPELLGEVEDLASQHPYSEPLWAALASLLHEVGRHHEGLDRLTALRRTLAEDLGLVAGPEVDDVERRILQHDRGPTVERARALSLHHVITARFPPVPTLIGRDTLLDQVGDLVAGTGLVTLIGPAGVGKTSIAVRVAIGAAERRAHGAVFVDLATIERGEPVWPSVAAAVGLRPSSPEDARDELLAALMERDQLVVLDNCEHVVDDAARLAAEVTHAARLTVLATSRVPLGCRHERVVQVPPLDRGHLTELFIERARASSSTFDPDDERDAIDELVARLDGLPLGVDLVAPLVRSTTPSEILEQTDLVELTTTTRTSTDRHRTLADAVAWSVALLRPAQRTLLARVGVFAGGALAASVRTVCSDESADGTVGAEPVLDVLRSLVDASLVEAERTSSGTWYRMLFPIREEAARLLRDDDATYATLAARHAAHVVELVRGLCRQIQAPQPTDGIRGFERHAVEIRRAHHHFVTTGDVDGRLDLLAALTPLALATAPVLPEAQSWLADLLDGLGNAPDDPEVVRRLGPERLLAILLNAVVLLDADADHHRARTMAAVRLADELGDLAAQTVAGCALCDLVSDEDTAAGADLGLRTVDLARRTGDSVLEGFALDFALNVSFRARRFDAVEAMVAEILSGDTRRFGAFEATVLYQVGRLRLARGEVDDAGAVFAQCERIALASGSAGGLGYALFGRCDVARRQGRWDEALALARNCAEVDQIVAPRELWGSLDRVARIGVRLGDDEAVASAVARFATHHRHHRHHRRAALEAARGCLAHLRGSTYLAERHLVDALEIVAEIGNASYFADLVDTLGFVTGVDLTETVLAVQDGAITPVDALARLTR